MLCDIIRICVSLALALRIIKDFNKLFIKKGNVKMFNRSTKSNFLSFISFSLILTIPAVNGRANVMNQYSQ